MAVTATRTTGQGFFGGFIPYVRQVAGRTVANIGGQFSAAPVLWGGQPSNLRIGGSPGAGARIYGSAQPLFTVPTASAYEGPTTLGQSTQGGQTPLPVGTRNGNYVWSGSSWTYNPISTNLPTVSPIGGGGGIPGTPSDGGGGISDFDFAAAYEPYLSALRGFEQQTIGARGEEEAGVEKRYATEAERVAREKGELETGLAEQERKAQVAGESAAAEARRAYNALVRQGQARFGAGSSAGPAITELATQEFYRQQGRLGEAGVNLQQEVVQEAGRIRNYITNKLGDLDTWKSDAFAAIKRNFDGQMNQIRLAIGQTESEKAQRRMDILQQAVARSQAIEDTDRSFRQNLAAQAVQYMAEASAISGRAWGAQDFTNAYDQILGQIQAVPSTTPALGMGQTETGMAQAFLPGTARRRPEEEGLAAIPLSPLGVGNV